MSTNMPVYIFRPNFSYLVFLSLSKINYLCAVSFIYQSFNIIDDVTLTKANTNDVYTSDSYHQLEM